MPAVVNTCATCRFALPTQAFNDAHPVGTVYECHRFPPDIGVSVWPAVFATDWCGEFQK